MKTGLRLRRLKSLLWMRPGAPADSSRIRGLIYSFRFDQARRELATAEAAQLLKPRTVSSLRKAVVWNLARAAAHSGGNPLGWLRYLARWQKLQCVGAWSAQWTESGNLNLSGAVSPGCSRVAIFINERFIRFVNTEALEDGKAKAFRFQLKKNLLHSLPPKARIGIGAESGYLKTDDGKWHFRHPQLTGNGSLFKKLAKKNYFVTKKGKLQLSFEMNDEWKARALSAYTSFSTYFLETFGYQPFLICGTLLGYYREGDFIAHDDDLDIAYLSRYTTPEEVKEEMKAMVIKLVSDGFDIRLSLKRGFFKPKINGVRFDVFPMWVDQGSLWMMNTTRQKATSEIILPLKSGVFRGVKVFVPNDTERYLENEYGPGWRVPDPGYRPVAEPGTLEYLKRSCLDVDELVALHEYYEKELRHRPGAGRFSVTGEVARKLIEKRGKE